MKLLTVASLFTLLMSANLMAEDTHFSTGHGKLDISSKKHEIDINLDLSAESILGFAHKPKTQEEKNKFNTLRDVWEKEALTKIVTIDPALGCRVSKAKFEHDEKKRSQPTYGEIEAELDIKCDKPVANSDITVHVIKAFPEIKTLHIQSSGPHMKTFESNNAEERIKL